MTYLRTSIGTSQVTSRQRCVQVDLMAEVLMPPGVRSLRQMLHATAVEVLLYLTQLHCQEMLDSLVDSLNIQYHRFLQRNPLFSVSAPPPKPSASICPSYRTMQDKTEGITLNCKIRSKEHDLCPGPSFPEKQYHHPCFHVPCPTFAQQGRPSYFENRLFSKFHTW